MINELNQCSMVKRLAVFALAIVMAPMALAEVPMLTPEDHLISGMSDMVLRILMIILLLMAIFGAATAQKTIMVVSIITLFFVANLEDFTTEHLDKPSNPELVGTSSLITDLMWIVLILVFCLFIYSFWNDYKEERVDSEFVREDAELDGDLVRDTYTQETSYDEPSANQNVLQTITTESQILSEDKPPTSIKVAHQSTVRRINLDD